MAKRKAKGGAPKGNRNAEKWTEETVMAELGEIELVIKSGGCYYIGNALAEVGLYNDIWSDWTNKFNDKEGVVYRTIKRLEQLLESNLTKGAIGGDLNPTMAIFTLKNKYGWRDTKQIEASGPDGGPMQVETTKALPDYTDEEVMDLADQIAAYKKANDES